MTFASSSLLPGIDWAQHSGAQQTGCLNAGSRLSLLTHRANFKFQFSTSEFGFQILDIGFRILRFRARGASTSLTADSGIWQLSFGISLKKCRRVQPNPISDSRFRFGISDFNFQIQGCVPRGRFTPRRRRMVASQHDVVSIQVTPAHCPV